MPHLYQCTLGGHEKQGISVLKVALQVHGQVETILYVEALPTKPCNAMIPLNNVALVSCEEILQ